MDPGARCAVHTERAAVIGCYRCGTYACETCCPTPSVLCAACVARLPPGANGSDWASLPSGPRALFLRAWMFAPLFVIVVLVALARISPAAPLVRSAYPWVFWVVQPAVMATWFGYFLWHVALSRRWRVAAAALGAGRPRRAAADLEAVLRGKLGVPIVHAAALHTFACTLTYAGDHARAIVLSDRLAAGAWSHGHRISARLLAARAHALTGDLAAAERSRDGIRLSWRRVFSTTADEDAVIAARASRWQEAHGHIEAANRYARRRGRTDLLRWTHVLDAFVLERAGASDDAIRAALAAGRETTAEVVTGLTRDWPELAEFVGRRLPELAVASSDPSRSAQTGAET